jgi:hypothetical protein
MADLPRKRLEADLPPFSNGGVDYFGPFATKRGRSLVKRYRVIFTFMSSRAVHLKMAHSLDTDSCINALRRFISRRGQIKHMRSDNGTNLVGAKRELQGAISSWNKEKILNTMLQNGIQWTFNPPAASHHGEVWKRLICMKDIYIKRRWKQVQYLADLFWKRWTKEYLSLLQERQKWTTVRRGLKVGDIVMVVDNTAPRGSWSLGRIKDVLPDSKGLVRTVKVSTMTGVFERPVTKLCLLLEGAEEPNKVKPSDAGKR